ncbi:PP2C family serine/threonine-protein phosphatase [Azotobacter salinestris]|uniref:PP2C family serine/threonine-protein phosphatase n=1 Tax=Azotobacter salinestris TaxID=69964 RepID=UPI0032DEEBD8
MAKLPVRNSSTRTSSQAGKVGGKSTRKKSSDERSEAIQAGAVQNPAVVNEPSSPTASSVFTPETLPVHTPEEPGTSQPQEPEITAQPLAATVTPAEAVSPPVFARCTGPWFSQYEAVAGLAHRDMPTPLSCQDAALASSDPRPWLLVADGAGSSAVSEIGARTVVTGLNRLLHTLEQQVAALLDAEQTPPPDEARRLALLLVKHARGLLADLAAEHRRPLKDFRCTLLLAVLGRRSLLWLKIGDGALVIERTQATAPESGEWQASLETLGHTGKGEFANQTTFIDEQLQPCDVQSALLSMEGVSGVALMSDGAADRLVSQDGSRVSGQLGLWFQDLRRNRLKRRSLTQRFYAEDFTHKTTGDDCSIALTASPLQP